MVVWPRGWEQGGDGGGGAGGGGQGGIGGARWGEGQLYFLSLSSRL